MPKAWRILVLPAGAAIVNDASERTAILFTSEWSLNYFKEKFPKIELSDIPFEAEMADR